MSCLRAGRTLSALARISSLLNFQQRRILIKFFTKAQFNYNSLTWTPNYLQRQSHLHERVLQLVYNDKIFTLEELLQRDNFHCAHGRNIKSLELSYTKLRPSQITSKIFRVKNVNYNSRIQTDFVTVYANTQRQGINMVSFRPTQSAFTCSKLTIETLEQGVKHVQS